MSPLELKNRSLNSPMCQQIICSKFENVQKDPFKNKNIDMLQVSKSQQQDHGNSVVAADTAKLH